MNDNIYTLSQYIECKTTILDKINAINSMLDALELKILDVTATSEFDEYSLDDGQMKVRTKYKSVDDVLAGLKALETLKQRYVNKYNGRTFVFRSGNIIH